MSKDLISVLVLPLGKLPSVFIKGCNSPIEYDFCVNETSLFKAQHHFHS